MRGFGWTRLAYLLFVLTALTAIVRAGDSGAEARPLTAGSEERREIPAFKRWTNDALSSLEDARGEAGGPGAPRIAEPRVPAVSAPAGRSEAPSGQGPTALTGISGEGPASGPGSSPPVFYRPSVSGNPGGGPVCGDLGEFPASSRVVFPLAEEYFYSYEDTWGAPRPQGGHEGTDLMTPAGVPEYAVTDGTVVPVSGSNPNGWNTLGGYAVMVRADYSIGPVKQGDLFYYAHLQRESPLAVGTRVRAGQVVGYSGDTGQGPEETRGLFPPHLHLGWYDGRGGRSAVDSGAMNPYPLLEWIKANGGAVTGGSSARYCEALGPRPSPEADWPARKDPGVRPDLDTGTKDPSPSPVVRKKAEETAGEERRPTKNPQRPKRPDKPPRKDHKRPPGADRREVQRPTKPAQPTQSPSKPAAPNPSEPDPSHGQYDPATGNPSDAPGGTTDRPSKTKPAAKNKPGE